VPNTTPRGREEKIVSDNSKCIRPKKCGFLVSQPYLAFLLDHACKCFHLEENVCGKWKFGAILGKFILGCGSTD
jgi:hypothetical protein